MLAAQWQFGRALADIRLGVSSLHLWPVLAWQEIKQRYRRSVLGPFWLTISTALFIVGMGPLFGALMGQSTAQYVHYLTVSFIVWIFISGLITEGCQAFIAAEGFIKQTRVPLTVHVLKVVWRNVLILAHNFVIVVLVWAYFSPRWSVDLLTVPAGVFLIACNGIWIGMLLGLLSARFRDIPQIIARPGATAFFRDSDFLAP